MDTYVYKIDAALYINLTNWCGNACDFCIRNGNDGIEDYKLWLKKEPSAADVIALIGDPKKYKEIVFCGFGEPLKKLDELKTIAKYVKDGGGVVRVNTNGQAGLIFGRDIVPELVGLVDKINVSLNASDRAKYQKICHSCYGEAAFDAMIAFARACVERLPEAVLSVVETIGAEEIKKCRALAKSIGAKLRVRKMIL
jgi:TatD family-associated radical SAM protein